MRHRQRRTVEFVGDEDLARADHKAQRQALGVAVARLEADPARVGLGRGAGDQVTQPHSGEDAGAHQVSADVVADAFEGHVLLRRRQRAEVPERQVEGFVDHPAHVQPPALPVYRRIPEVLGDDIEVLDWGDVGRDTAQPQLGWIEDRPIPVGEQAQCQGAQAHRGDRDRHGGQQAAAALIDS